MSRLVAPALPIDPELGTTWKPEQASRVDGTDLGEFSEFADGLIRVRKQCRNCGKDYDGWMFLAHYRRRPPQPQPYHMGPYRACDACVDIDERRSEIAGLDWKVDRARQRWDAARTLTKKVPAARELVNLLDRLVALLEFGSDRFAKASAQLDAVRSWIDERRPTEDV